MAQTGFTPIVTYNTATATTVPSAANLAQGELAVNVTDKKLYTKDSGGNVVLLASNGGDVTGPASSTNLAIPTFSGTGGKTLLDNAGATISAGVITATGFSGPLTGNASTVTTNANLTGPITSVGNATSIASQTGTGTKFVVDTSPTLVTPTATTTIGVGAATPSASGAGITFPATASLSTNANTLDDYEEGPWTPDLLINGANTGITGTQTGRYTKIGRSVIVECTITLTNKGARVGGVRVGGLPFTPAIDALPAAVVPTGTWAGLIVGGSIQAYVSGTAVYLLLGTLTGTTSLTDANLTNTSAFTFTATYSV